MHGCGLWTMKQFHCHKNNPFNIIILSLYNGLVCLVILRGFVEAARAVATSGSVKGDDDNPLSGKYVGKGKVAWVRMSLSHWCEAAYEAIILYILLVLTGTSLSHW